MSDLDVKTRPARASVTGGGQRQTRPGNWHPFSRGGIGVIPRRSLTSPAQINTRAGLSSYAENSPLRLLALLESIDPDVSLANDTDITLICDPECVQIVAYSDTDDDTPEPGDTELLTQFWDSQPSEIGGLYGFMAQMVTLANFTGMMCAEAVPGRSGTGVYRAWPVDSLTIGFGRDDESADLTAYQRQSGGSNNGWQRLNAETFFWETLGKWPDSPYGCGRYAPALAEVLVNTAMWRSITDAVQNAAWPRLGFGFPFKMLMELFHTLGYDKVAAEAAAIEEMERFKREVNSIMSDDNVFYDADGKITVIPGGSFQGIEPIIEERRSRIVRALKQLPLFLGLNDSSTETQAAKQMIIHGKRLGSLRNQIVAIAVKISNLHLRLMGRPTVAKAVMEPIFPGDALAEANAEAIKIKNADEKERLGYIDHDQASMEITGSGAVAEKQEPILPGTGTQPGDDEETNRERQVRERRQARQALRQEYAAKSRTRRLRAEQETLPRKGLRERVADLFAYNKNHDPNSGRFSSGGGGVDIGAGEEATPSRSAKSLLAQQTSRRVGAEVQRYSEEHCEAILSKGVKGVSLRDNEPVDVMVTRSGVVSHGIELKTMTDNKNGRIHMKPAAQERKQSWVNENKANMHTVVFDDQKVFNANGKGKHDDSQREIYYRRGFGSMSTSAMHKVSDMDELNKLLDMKAADLPTKARAPKSYVPPEPRSE